jgi:hypothetical protein
MPLTEHEDTFLAAFIYEATNEPFTGPATRSLHARGVSYTDLYSLMTAYAQLHPGTPECPFGTQNPNPPPCPWPDRETALRREADIREELSEAAERNATAPGEGLRQGAGS